MTLSAATAASRRRSLTGRLRRAACLVAVLLALGGARSVLAAEYVVDNTDAGVQVNGPWSATTTTPGFLGPDYRFRVGGDGAATVRWSYPPAAAAGRYEVYARWSGGQNRATNATYHVGHAAGISQVAVNQKENGGSWQRLGTFDFAPGRDHGVLLSNRGDGVVVADAIRWVGPLGAGGTDQTAQVQAVAAATPGPAAPTSPRPTSTPSPAPVPTAQPTPADARSFEQTRYRVGDDRIWDFFVKRGGVRTFGYPVSNTFTLFGMKTQVFQRQVLQIRPDGGVQTMNLLDEGLMPYTRINGSSFPAPDPEVIKRAPRSDDPAYHEKALQFVRDLAPDEMDGNRVGFSRTFFETVRAEDAFPSGAPPDADGLLSGFNLEIWGLPTSKPTYDPNNRGFLYQRFQRGIMHYDKSCGCTQGLLLADAFKSMMTGQNLPADLSAQAKGSRFLAQWSPTKPLGLARPGELPGSDWQGAFRRDGSILLDAGHGGKEIGTSARYPDGTVLQEKALNLRLALRLRDLLSADGYQVTLSRTTDAGVNTDNRDLTGDGKVTVSDDLQARVDLANRLRVDVLVSVHFNGVSNPDFKGTYTFWDPDRPFSNRGQALAELVQAALVKQLKDAGYATVDRGARTDKSVLGGGYYYLLSPKTEIVARPSEMPAIIGEALFLTNQDDANALRNDQIVEAIARGYLDGIRAYFARFPPG